MGERMPEQRYDPFQNDNDRRVVASVVWRKNAMVGIVVVRRRDGRSALIPTPELAQPMLARGVSRESVCQLWGDLRLAVEWALRELEFENLRGFALDPLLNGDEPAECGSLRAFGGDVIGVDIGEFE